jgi:hypothetical protein
MNLPNTLLIGAHKAGTSSFYSWLSQHPEIYAIEEMKDFHYFLFPKFYSRGLPYLANFFRDAGSQKIILKGAVQYIYFPEVAQRCFEFNPDLKLILILRNPVRRAYSAHQYLNKLGMDDCTFEEAIQRERDTDFTEIFDKAKFEYLEHGFYTKQIESYLKWFPKSQLKILLYEELIEDKEIAIKETFKFLNISQDFKPEFEHLNRTGSPKFRWINYLIFGDNSLKSWFSKWFPIQNLIPLPWKIKLGNLLREVNTTGNKTTDKLDNELYKELIKLYREDMQKLSVLLDKDMTKVWHSNICNNESTG